MPPPVLLLLVKPLHSRYIDAARIGLEWEAPRVDPDSTVEIPGSLGRSPGE